jgi:hypothetical protein
MAMEEWSEAEFQQFQNLELPEEAFNDPFVQLAYDMALFSPELDYDTHVALKQFLLDHLSNEYGFDFMTEFDWNEYKLLGESDA